MGTTTTTTRPTPGTENICKSYKNGVLINSQVLNPGSFQTTTSYRTGQRAAEGSGGDPFEDAILNAKKYREYFKSLKTERQQDGSSRWDKGHEFFTYKSTADRSQARVGGSNRIAPDTYSYSGYTYINPSYHRPSGEEFRPAPPYPDVAYWGTKLIHDTVPVKPELDLMSSLAELRREGLPALPGLAALGSFLSSNPKNGWRKKGRDRGGLSSIGSEILNIEFGYKPLAADLATLAKVILEGNKLLEQYARDSGRQVRRRRELPETYASWVYPLTTAPLLILSNNSNVRPFKVGNVNKSSVVASFYETVYTKQRIWFSGAYMYYAPDATVNSALAWLRTKESQAHRLIGDVSLETLWDLAPWTWFSDWNRNIGTVLSNIDSFRTDNLVLRYGYLMVSDETTREISAFPSGVDTGASCGGSTGPWKYSFKIERKIRRRANPYGFSTNPSSYTDRQWTILGALGATKAPGILP